MTATSFAEFDLPQPIARAIAVLGFQTPTPIQAAAIPALLGGNDVVGVAHTGTGKTAAFGLPLLAAIDPRQAGAQALVLCPTRELAQQVAAALSSFATGLGIGVTCVYGGAPFGPQRAALARGAQVVVGTPGRIIDHLRRGSLTLGKLSFLVLDEADEMLAMGFAEDVDTIAGSAPADRQTALFSATMPSGIRRVAQAHLRHPIDVSVPGETRIASGVEQTYAVISFRHKVDALRRVLDMAEDPESATLVFVRTKSACDEVGAALAGGYASAVLNGDVPQREREKIVARLRAGTVDVVVATDVAARGLDVDRIGLVVNFDAPRDAETYVHRIGRTGRAGRSGKSLTLFTPKETYQIRQIEKSTGSTMAEVELPTTAQVAAFRTRAQLRLARARVAGERIDTYRQLFSDYAAKHAVSAYDLAAALLANATGDSGLSQAPDELDDEVQRVARTKRRSVAGTRGDHGHRPRRDGARAEKPRRDGGYREGGRDGGRFRDDRRSDVPRSSRSRRDDASSDQAPRDQARRGRPARAGAGYDDRGSSGHRGHRTSPAAKTARHGKPRRSW